VCVLERELKKKKEGEIIYLIGHWRRKRWIECKKNKKKGLQKNLRGCRVLNDGGGDMQRRRRRW
jgi:hypothetical protein